MHIQQLRVDHSRRPERCVNTKSGLVWSSPWNQPPALYGLPVAGAFLSQRPVDYQIICIGIKHVNMLACGRYYYLVRDRDYLVLSRGILHLSSRRNCIAA